MAFDPKQCRVLLVGKLMARLEPFLKSKGYPHVESEELGSGALTLLTSASYHLVLLELNLGDVELTEFFLAARARQGDASFILLAAPGEAEMVVSALVLGADAYVPLPPEEQELFHVLERQGAAAVHRKSANPDAQPGASAKLARLEEELATARAQVADLEEQNALFEAEAARLGKLLDAAKQAPPPAAAEVVPAGHKVIAVSALEELESRATFAEFLESENDEIKKERDTLLERLRAFGLADDDEGDAFDEPTGAIHIEDEVLAHATPRATAVDKGAISPADAGDDSEDEGEELLLDDGDDDGDDDGGDELLLDDGGDELLRDDGDDDDDGDEIDLAALEAMMVKSVPAKVSASERPVAAAPKPAALPPPQAEPAPPPSADDSDEDYDEFEDVNTDALLRLAADVSGEGPSPDELEELLASLDEE